MKRIILFFTIITMLFVASCAKNTNTPDTENQTNESTQNTAGTVGQTLSSQFKEIVTNDPSLSVTSIADKLAKNSVITFSPTTMTVEEGQLSGFDNAEIKGFNDAVTIAPMIGTIPFVCYVFDVNENTDINEFKATLSDNANMRWNICTEAEETVIENVGNKVFFLMCPKSLDE